MVKKKFWKKMSPSQKEQLAKILLDKDNKDLKFNILFSTSDQIKQHLINLKKLNRKKSLSNQLKSKLVWISFKRIDFFFSVVQAVFLSIYCGKVQTYLLNCIISDPQKIVFNYVSSEHIQILLSNLGTFFILIIYALIYLYILYKLLHIIYILIKYFYIYFKDEWEFFIQYDILRPLHNFRMEHGLLFGLAIGVIKFIIKYFI